MTQTAEGMLVGTATYMAPEQAQGLPADVRSDIFSFGAVLYELVAGRRAFAGNTSVQILAAVLHDNPAPLRTGTELDSIVTKCLQKNARERFQSMSELRVALEHALTGPATSEPSIAVLPFANLSADKENEYFSDGLAEEIINALANIPGLKVTARTSAFAFKGREQDVRSIGEALDVRTVLEGSVRRAGSRIRVTAQLIDTADGYHLWSERYDAEMADVFAVQDEIATAICRALQVKLSGRAHVAPRYTPDVACYEAYLKALHEAQKLTPQSLSHSQKWFEQAIALDPQFALAHSMYAFHYSQLANYALLPVQTAMPLVRREARRALEIDPTLPDGHAMLGLVAALYDYDWPEAERCFERAMQVEPVPSSVRRHYALGYLLPTGRYREAADECARALSDDPLNVMSRLRYAQCLRGAGQLEQAQREQHRALELDEHLWFSHFLIGFDHMLDGEDEHALRHIERAHTLAPWNPSATGLRAAALWRTGDTAPAAGLLTLMEGEGGGPAAL